MEQLSTSSAIILSVVLLFLLLLSGYFSGCESSFSSLTKEKWIVYKKEHKNNFLIRSIDTLNKNYSMTLSTVLIGNNLVNIGATTISTVLFTSMFYSFGFKDESAILGITTAIMTILVIIFGEYIPKNFAKQNPLKFALFAGIPLYFFYYLFWPISFTFNFLFRTKKEEKVTEKEISYLIDIAEDDDVFEISEAELIKNAMTFDEKKVKDAMRKTVISINYESNSKTILETFEMTRYTRLPVVKNKKVIGILNIKQFLLAYIENQMEDLDIDKFIDVPLFATEEEKLDVILKKIKMVKKHMAIVVDNLNNKKMIGIITLEDLLEEIVGEIYDEQDILVNDVENFHTNSWLVKPNTNAYEFLSKNFPNVDFTHDKKINMINYVKKEFKLKKVPLNSTFENEWFRIFVFQHLETKKKLLEIIKK